MKAVFVILLVFSGAAAIIVVIYRSLLPGHLREKAEEAEKAGNISLAASLYGRLLEIKPDLKDVRWKYARALADLSEYDAAAREMRLLLNSGCGDEVPEAEVFHLFGEILSRMQKTMEAYDLLLEAVEKHPSDPRLLLSLARTADDIGEGAVALSTYEKAISVSPDLDTAVKKELASLLRRMKRIERAASIYREVVAQAPDDLEALSELGDLLLELGETAEARMVYERLLEFQTGNRFIEVSLLLATTIEKMGEFDAAAAVLRRAGDTADATDRARAKALYRLGILHERAGRDADADVTFEECYDLDPECEDVARRVSKACKPKDEGDALARTMKLPTARLATLAANVLGAMRYDVLSKVIVDNDAVNLVVRRIEDGKERTKLVYFRRWTQEVGQLPVSDLHLEILDENLEGGLFITTSHFAPSAVQFAASVKIIELVWSEPLSRTILAVGIPE